MRFARSLTAQQPKKVPRIGFLSAVSSASIPRNRIEAFQQGLRELGYVEGQNIVIEYRYADGKQDRLKEIVAELLRLKVERNRHGAVPQQPVRAKEATSTTPIVMGFDNDPVGVGICCQSARPGKNITGLSTLHPEISGKQLELLKEIVPKLSRVARSRKLDPTGQQTGVNRIESRRGGAGIAASLPRNTNFQGYETLYSKRQRKGVLKRSSCWQNPVINYISEHIS